MLESYKETDPKTGVTLFYWRRILALKHFHRVGSMVPKDQLLEGVGPETTVSEAIEFMKKNRYSQLPVFVEGQVLGVFSYRSFASAIIHYDSELSEVPISELPVIDFLEQFGLLYEKEDWKSAERFLDKDDAFFVRRDHKPLALVTATDVYTFLRGIAEPFVFIAEIEQELRHIIWLTIEKTELSTFLARIAKKGNNRHGVPQELQDLRFYQLIDAVSDDEVWSHLHDAFGNREHDKVRFQQRLQRIRAWRNDLFHFRRVLEPKELAQLAGYRDWLHSSIAVFDARQSRVEAEQDQRREEEFEDWFFSEEGQAEIEADRLSWDAEEEE